jgi:transcriptional regulator with XRE-family HTH domain
MDTNWFKSRKKELGITDADVAEKLAVDRSVANKILNGKVGLDAQRIDRLARLFQVSRDEIMRRSGITSDAGPRPLDIARAPEQLPTRGAFDDVGAVRLRCLNLTFAMGDGSDLEDWIDETTVDFDANWLHSITSSPSDRLIIGKGIGDSMTPTIGDHDDVLIDLNDNRLDKTDRIWAITISGAGAVKRLMPAGQGMVEVLSDNPMHPNRVRTIPKEEIRIIGRVIWSGRRH